MDEQLRALQKAQLHIACEIRRICEKHGIDFFLVSGTLLGAVRHGGFIPWDDDMDVGMTRDNYDRFERVVRDELGEEFFFQSGETDKRYAMHFSKIRLNGTKFREIPCGHVRMHQGVFVDIFVYDAIPDDAALLRRQEKRLRLFSRLLLAKSRYILWSRAQTKKRLAYGAVRLLTLPLPYRFLHRRLRRALTAYRNTEGALLCNFERLYTTPRDTVRREWTQTLIPVTFEGETFPAFADYDAYLTEVYGDYMTPPPPEEQVNKHHLLERDLGPYAPAE